MTLLILAIRLHIDTVAWLDSELIKSCTSNMFDFIFKMENNYFTTLSARNVD